MRFAKNQIMIEPQEENSPSQLYTVPLTFSFTPASVSLTEPALYFQMDHVIYSQNRDNANSYCMFQQKT